MPPRLSPVPTTSSPPTRGSGAAGPQSDRPDCADRTRAVRPGRPAGTRVQALRKRWRTVLSVPGQAEFAGKGPLTLVTSSGTARYRGTLRSAWARGEGSSARERWGDLWYAAAKRHDEFGYLTRDEVAVSVDSKQTFDEVYRSNWYYYFK